LLPGGEALTGDGLLAPGTSNREADGGAAEEGSASGQGHNTRLEIDPRRLRTQTVRHVRVPFLEGGPGVGDLPVDLDLDPSIPKVEASLPSSYLSTRRI